MERDEQRDADAGGWGEDRTALEAVLAPLDREELLALLLDLAEGEPELADWITARATGQAPSTAPLPPVEPDALRQELRAALRPRGRRRRYDDYGPGETGSYALSEGVGRARPYLNAGDGRSALAILEVVAEELTENLEQLSYEDDDTSFLCEEMGKSLAEAVLTADLTPAERQEWAQRIEAWSDAAADYSMEEAFEAARRAVLQGWEFPPLQRVLQGETAGTAGTAEEPLDSTDTLTEVRLEILRRQGRWEEYLRLAEAERKTEPYVTALVRLGRIGEAVEYGLKQLSSRQEALALARALEKAGAAEEALRVAEHALAAVEAGPYPSGELARWTRDLAARLGQRERALAAALTAVREHPSLSDYLAVEASAGERWPELRAELLEEVRRRQPYHPSDEVDIFLHEGLIEDAIAAVDESPRHALVERVVEAALPTHADWAFRACTHQFDRIADAGKSQYYHEAVAWLVKAKAALASAGREAEWREYLDGAIAKHSRKHSLRPLLQRLR